MPIPVSCPSCGRHTVAPDTLAGMQVSCKQCGSLFMVPDAAPEVNLAPPAVGSASRSASAPAAQTAPPAKVCSTCGVDLSRSKRTKDPSGLYYCETCWSAKQEAAREAAAPLAPPPPPVQRDRPAKAVENLPMEFPGDASSADDAAPVSADAIYYPCCVCELLCTAREVFDEGGGQVICKSCWNLRQRQSKPLGIEQPDNAEGSDVPAPAPAAGGNAGDLFCEGCQGIFPPDKLKLAPDGAVLCKKCMKARGRAA